MSYERHKSNAELHTQLLFGLKKHLLIAQTTSESKQKRLESMKNLGDVLEYIIDNMNQAIPEDEQAIYSRFFSLLLVKV